MTLRSRSGRIVRRTCCKIPSQLLVAYCAFSEKQTFVSIPWMCQKIIAILAQTMSDLEQICCFSGLHSLTCLGCFLFRFVCNHFLSVCIHSIPVVCWFSNSVSEDFPFSTLMEHDGYMAQKNTCFVSGKERYTTIWDRHPSFTERRVVFAVCAKRRMSDERIMSWLFTFQTQASEEQQFVFCSVRRKDYSANCI